MRPPQPPVVRAEVMRVLFAFGSGGQQLRAPEALELGLPRLTVHEYAMLELATDEDLALANACLAVEYELRERAYAALERLCARAAGQEGDLDERLRALPLPTFADAAECLYELGWVTPEDDEEEEPPDNHRPTAPP